MKPPTYLLRLRPRGLKFLLRSCGLRAVSVEEIPEQGMRADALSSASQSHKETDDV
jgi:hypothetical protein